VSPPPAAAAPAAPAAAGGSNGRVPFAGAADADLDGEHADAGVEGQYADGDVMHEVDSDRGRDSEGDDDLGANRPAATGAVAVVERQKQHKQQHKQQKKPSKPHASAMPGHRPCEQQPQQQQQQQQQVLHEPVVDAQQLLEAKHEVSFLCDSAGEVHVRLSG
jgi:hypothetical protein